MQQRREAEPAKGFTVVLRNAFAGEVPVAEVELRGGVTLGSEAAQSRHVRHVLAADERYYGQQPDAARRCDQPTMSLPHEAAIHFLILIVRASQGRDRLLVRRPVVRALRTPLSSEPFLFPDDIDFFKLLIRPC